MMRFENFNSAKDLIRTDRKKIAPFWKAVINGSKTLPKNLICNRKWIEFSLVNIYLVIEDKILCDK